MMDRRSFLSRFVGGLAGLVALGTVDPESLLWIPGEKAIFLPPAGGWVGGGNFFATPAWVAREVAKFLSQNTRFAQKVDARFYVYDIECGYGLRLGDTIPVRVPKRFEANFNPTPEPPCDNIVAVPLDKQFFVTLPDLAVCKSEAEARTRYIEPAAASLSVMAVKNNIDVFGRLPFPSGDTLSSARAEQGGISIRGIEFFDFPTGEKLTRVDFLGGSLRRALTM